MIYPMKPEDYYGIYQLWRSCSGMGLNDPDDSREGMEAFLKKIPPPAFLPGKTAIMWAPFSAATTAAGDIFTTLPSCRITVAEESVRSWSRLR